MIDIRNLKKEDTHSVIEIYNQYWSDDFGKHLAQKTAEYFEKTHSIIEQQFQFFVAEENQEILGIAAIRSCPSHMVEFSTTSHPAELYVLASKYKKNGTGKMLIEKVIEEVKKNGFTEIVLYSGETHQDSWGFYDTLGFERVGDAIAPNGEEGKIWRITI